MNAPVIRLHPDDGVVIARATLLPGTSLGSNAVATMRIPAGHKAAIRAFVPGDPVIRYGQIIGFATQPISPGQHVHSHNLGMGEYAKDYAYGVATVPTAYVDTPAPSWGYAVRTGGSPRATISASSPA